MCVQQEVFHVKFRTEPLRTVYLGWNSTCTGAGTVPVHDAQVAWVHHLGGVVPEPVVAHPGLPAARVLGAQRQTTAHLHNPDNTINQSSNWNLCSLYFYSRNKDQSLKPLKSYNVLKYILICHLCFSLMIVSSLPLI